MTEFGYSAYKHTAKYAKTNSAEFDAIVAIGPRQIRKSEHGKGSPVTGQNGIGQTGIGQNGMDKMVLDKMV